MLKEAGPEIFVQSHSLIVPSASLEFLPSSKTLSVGKIISWSGPETAFGGLLFLVAQPSHEVSFLQERFVIIPKVKIKAKKYKRNFMWFEF